MSDIKISALPPATSVNDSDVFPIVQSGTTKKAGVGLISAAFLSTNVFRVDPDVGAAPFQTVQVAIDAIEALDPIPRWPVIDIGNNIFSENVTTSLDTIAFVGRRPNTELDVNKDNGPFSNLTFDASSNSQQLLLSNCSVREGTITGNTTGGFYVHLINAETGVVKNVAATPAMYIHGYGNSFIDSVQDTSGGGTIEIHELSLAPDGQLFGQSDTTWTLFNCIGVKFLPASCASFTVENTPILVTNPPSISIHVTRPTFLPLTNSAGNATILGLSSKNGVPDVSFTGFEKGSLCMDTANGKLYVNGGDATTPNWKLVTSA